MASDPPFSRGSKTSAEAARAIKLKRILSQEQWVYEALQQMPMTDHELWERAQRFPELFEQETSLHRTRITLKWIDKVHDTTPYHPVEDSGVERKSKFGRANAVWRLKEAYREMLFAEWAEKYRSLAKGIGKKHDPS